MSLRKARQYLGYFEAQRAKVQEALDKMAAHNAKALGFLNAAINAPAEPITAPLVHNRDELMSAMRNGRSEIVTAPGDYGEVDLPSGVSISAADSRASKFSKLTIIGESNVILAGIRVEHIRSEGEPEHSRAVVVRESSQVSFTDCELHGSVDGDYANDTYMLGVENSRNILFIDGHIHDAARGIIYSGVDRLELSRTLFEDLREDGVTATKISNFIVEHNDFRRFHPSQGDHVDAFQIFATEAGADSRDGVFRFNYLNDPGAPQFFFAETRRDDVTFARIKVHDNISFARHGTSCRIYNAIDCEVFNNTYVMVPNDNDDKSNIMFTNSKGENVIRDNLYGAPGEGNHLLSSRSPNDWHYYENMLVGPINHDSPREAFKLKPEIIKAHPELGGARIE